MLKKSNPKEGSYLSQVETRLEHHPENQAPKYIGSSFYRGEHCNFNPYQSDYMKSDFLEMFLLKGWKPERPFISPNTKITAFGSCFARHITQHLGLIQYNVSKDRAPDIYISTIGEGLVNMHALAQQFEWAFLGKTPPENLWHGFKAEVFGYDENIRQRTRTVFLETNFFIITLGLSEVWYDEQTGGVLWRAVPKEIFDDSRHKFRVCSFDETLGNIHKIYDLIREHVRDAKVLFTLSPVPLAATFRDISCITANSASKAILKAALDEFYRSRPNEVNKSLYYFPSYEIVMDLFQNRFVEDNRHPHAEIIDFIMNLFEAVYCRTGLDMDRVTEKYATARKATTQRLIELFS